MKILKEEVETVATVPELLKDTIIPSKKKEPMFDTQKLKNERPFLGASKQPTPDKIKEPKAHLEESMFETIMNEEVNLNEDNGGWTISNKAQDAADCVTEFLEAIKLPSTKDISDFLSEEEINQLMSAVEILQDTARYASDDYNESLTEATEYNPSEKETFWELAKKEMSPEAYDELCKAFWQSCEDTEAEESLMESDAEDEIMDDMYERVAIELAPGPDDLFLMRRRGVTKFPDIKSSGRYHYDDIHVNYDGNFEIYGPSVTDNFAFAKRVADAYNLNTRVSAKGDKITVYTADLIGVPTNDPIRKRGRKPKAKPEETED